MKRVDRALSALPQLNCLEFENSAVIARFIRMGGSCGGMAATNEPLADTLLPQSAARYVGDSLAPVIFQPPISSTTT